MAPRRERTANLKECAGHVFASAATRRYQSGHDRRGRGGDAAPGETLRIGSASRFRPNLTVASGRREQANWVPATYPDVASCMLYPPEELTA